MAASDRPAHDICCSREGDAHVECATDDERDRASAPERAVFTRRRLFGAAAMGLGAYGLGRLPIVADSAIVATLDQPGQALVPASRVPHTSPPTTTTTTTTTTVVPGDPEAPITTVLPIAEPADGEIAFPIVVGEDDSCFVLDNFGDCRSGCSRLHEGVDIMADAGLAVVAVSAGVITRVYEDRGLTWGAGNGWTIYDEDEDVTYKYFHLRHHALGLAEGDRVERGQVIGTVGETGTSGAGRELDNFHLHFEYRPGNIARNAFGLLHRAPHVRFQGD